jgi:hypothetical protein
MALPIVVSLQTLDLPRLVQVIQWVRKRGHALSTISSADAVLML